MLRCIPGKSYSAWLGASPGTIPLLLPAASPAAILPGEIPSNARRRILVGAPRTPLFHALNQRVDAPARRTVTTFHDLFVLTAEYSSPEFRARFAQQARDAAERSDLIIAVSAFTARQVESCSEWIARGFGSFPMGRARPSESQNLTRARIWCLPWARCRSARTSGGWSKHSRGCRRDGGWPSPERPRATEQPGNCARWRRAPARRTSMSWATF